MKLYLLDSNDAANFPAHRGITSELYGGGPELRLTQELLLGIGGWRLLRALGIHPDVCHLNEGHAAFAVLERARTFMEETGQPFHVALATTRVGNLFTTHTAVAAGFDRFAPALMEQYLGRYAKMLGIKLQDLLALGRQNAGDSSESFNMAYLAIRGSGAVNGVSRLHGKVSRNLFLPLFPRWPEDEVPVGHVTNGVHMPTWDSAPADDLWTESCGKQRWLGTTETMESDIRSLPDARLWQFRTTEITTLFLDVGDVLLNDGWDHHARRRAAKYFKLPWAEMEKRHRLTFETHEEGKLTFEEYLHRVVFYEKRPFTRAQFQRFIFAQSKACPEMIELVARLKERYRLKIAVVSNESREVNAYRIRKFKLDGFVDSFVSSCFVHIRKPDADIFRLALDIAQARARQVLYIENTPMFVQIAEGLGIRSILHTDYASTCAKLATFGLRND